jgi:cell division protein FtsW
MIEIARTDRSLLGNWWWTVDRFMLAGLLLLLTIGIVAVFAASPPVARTLGRPETFFVVKHLGFVLPAALLLLGASLLAPLGVLRLGIGMLAGFGLLLVATPLIGAEIKGAYRWIGMGGLLLQPSEFVKPALAIVAAYLLARRPGLTGMTQAALPVAIVVAILLAQPDLGMAGVVAAVFGVQLFVAGLPWLLVLAGLGLGLGGVWYAYLSFPHVAQRIDSFMASDGSAYQVERALSAVASGGLLGKGPGEGSIKFTLPDAHTDFIFAATAEEFGVIACLLIVALFASLFLRGLGRAQASTDRFVQLAACGLACQFGLQALVNIAVNLNLFPTKGMTLPFISYGGSSMLALALGTGALLALTRRGARLGVPG